MTGTAPLVGATAQFTATAALADASSKSVTTDAAWQSSNPAIATVTSAGVVTGVVAGEVDVSATYQSVTGKLHIAIPVSGAPLSRITVAGTAPIVGASAQFTATATLDDSTTRNVTSVATWTSSNPLVATVSDGLVTGVAAGQSEISATYQSSTGTTRAVIVAAACTFSVFPSSVSIPAGGGTATLSVSVVQQGTTCGWTATSSDSFVTITGATSGNGSGSTSIVVSANTGDARTATLRIGGREVTVSQGAGNCVASLSPPTRDFSAEFTKATVEVMPSGFCQWTAVSQSPWIVLDPFHTSGTGLADFTFTLFGNVTGAPRTGTIKVLQQTFTLTQRAPVGGNAVSFVSEPGDRLGEGLTVLFEDPTSVIVPTLDAAHNHISFWIVGTNGTGSAYWTLEMASPQGRQLVPGTYLNAAQYGTQLPTIPGLDFYGNGSRCGGITGQFTVTEAVFGAGGAVQRFVATFDQHCGGAAPALHGRIVFGH